MAKKTGLEGIQAAVNRNTRPAPAVPASQLNPPAHREGSPEWQAALKGNGGVWPGAESGAKR